MEPGRFLSVSFLALGVVTLVHAGLEALLAGNRTSGLALSVMGLVWCGLGGYRMRTRGGEREPREYGFKTYAIALLIGGYVTFLGFWLTLQLF